MAAARRVGAPLDGTFPAIPTRLSKEEFGQIVF
jgi:hypothetical protein